MFTLALAGGGGAVQPKITFNDIYGWRFLLDSPVMYICAGLRQKRQIVVIAAHRELLDFYPCSFVKCQSPSP
jgi:hypothetical protein